MSVKDELDSIKNEISEVEDLLSDAESALRDIRYSMKRIETMPKEDISRLMLALLFSCQSGEKEAYLSRAVIDYALVKEALGAADVAMKTQSVEATSKMIQQAEARITRNAND